MRAEDTRRKAEYRILLVFCVLSVCAVIGASAATWYADNGLGNNGFDGSSQVITNGRGPKRNIANAIAAASSGDVVSVAAGYYQESQWTPGTKTLTFPSGPVTLVNYDPGQTDTDGDRIPDWWMLKYFGHPTGQTSDQSCASCYYNGNPLTNLEEYQRGLDPTNTCPALVLYTANYQTNIVCKAVSWSGDFVVGSNSFADVLLIQNGGVLSNTGIGYVGYETSSSNNSVLVTGAGSVWSNASYLVFGASGAGNSMVISGGGRVVVYNYAYVGFSGLSAPGSNNSVLVTDPGSVWDTGPSLEIGVDNVGGNSGGNSLVISNGGEVIGGSPEVGGGDSNRVVVTGAGSVWNNSAAVSIDGGASNSLVISDGGEVDSTDAIITGVASNRVVITGIGSIWNASGGLVVGGGPDGFSDSLVIASAGRLVTGYGVIGDEAGGDTVLVTGSSSVWSCSGDLIIGTSSAYNSLVISDGGKVLSDNSYLGGLTGEDGDAGENTMLVTGPGSVWSNNHDLVLGNYGDNNSLVISNGGLLVSGGAMVVGVFANDNTVVISDGGTVAVSTNLLVGDNAGYVGNCVTLSGGSLTATNALGAGLLNVGYGTLTINNGTCAVDTLRLESGTLAALVFNGGTLRTERAVIANGAELWFALGTNSHPIQVTGNMVLGAYLNITDGGGFTNGTYTLFTYGGTLMYDGVIVGTAPATNFAYMVDTTTNGQVNLVVTLPGITGITILMAQSNTISGVTNLPVQVSLFGNQQLAGVTFLLDGEGSRAMIDPLPPFFSQISGSFDTTLTTNGWHTIQAVATYPSSSLGGSDIYTSQVVVVRTQNHITFPDMLFTWDTALNIRATLDTQITNWTASIFGGDYDGSPSNHLLRTYSGITSNGLIDFLWDGNDSNGVAFAPGVFTNVTFVIDDPAGKSVWREGVQQPSNFLVSYMTLVNEFSAGSPNFIDMITQVAYYIAISEPTYYLDTSGTGLQSTWKITDSHSGWNDWATKVSSNQIANLFYFGHGSADTIGFRPTNPDSGFNIDELEIFTANTVVESGFFFKSRTPKFKVPYHFVFFDGCETAKGNWCEAFGIERIKTTTAAYQTNGVAVAPKAFLGWQKLVPYASAGTFSLEHDDFVVSLFSYWSTHNDGLQDALNHNPRQTLVANVRIWGAQDLLWNSP